MKAQPSKEHLITRLRRYANVNCGETGRGLIGQQKGKEVDNLHRSETGHKNSSLGTITQHAYVYAATKIDL